MYAKRVNGNFIETGFPKFSHTPKWFKGSINYLCYGDGWITKLIII